MVEIGGTEPNDDTASTIRMIPVHKSWSVFDIVLVFLSLVWTPRAHFTRIVLLS